MVAYDQYKESGIDWIGKIPLDWEIHPAKHAFSEITTKNVDGRVKTALKFTAGQIVKKQNFEADTDNYVAETILSYTIVEPNTIMINGLNLNYDLKSLRVGIVREQGVITSAYLALKPDESKINPDYANYLFKGYETKMAFHNMGVGLRLTLGFREFRKQPILIPSMYEQTAIADYLDDKVSRIDQVIAEAKASIEEYKSLKASVIYEAVTKGLDPTAEMKDSGVPSIGLIPLHWQCCKIRQVSDGITDGTHGTYQRLSCGHLLLSSKNVREDELLIGDDESYISEEDFFQITASGFPKKNDLLLCCIGASIGRCIVYDRDETIAFQRSVIFIRPNERIRSKMLRYNMLSECTLQQEQLLVNQSAQPGLYQGAVAEIYVTLPPLVEQDQIIERLDSKCSSIDSLISEKESLISDLEAYKKSLIYEVVTGKRKVV